MYKDIFGFYSKDIFLLVNPCLMHASIELVCNQLKISPSTHALEPLISNFSIFIFMKCSFAQVSNPFLSFIYIFSQSLQLI